MELTPQPAALSNETTGLTEINIHSSALRAASYDQQGSTLTMTWSTGDTYLYHGVPPEIAQQLATSSSQGQFAYKYIRNNYPFTKA